MEAAFELEGSVIAVPQCGKKLLEQDDRAFDAEMVRGALVLLNLCLVGRSHPISFSFENSRLPSAEEAIAIANKAFGWVPEVIHRRAEAAGMPDPLSRLGWTKPTPEEIATCTDAVWFFVFPMHRLAQQTHLDLGRRILTMDKWFNEVMRALPIYSWYRYKEKQGVHLAAVPVLTGVQQCMAYAVAVVQVNRWKPSIIERIRMCPYQYPQLGDRQKGHYFLDYRFGADGELEKNRQKFCCHEHANRFKQRKHREKKAREERDK